MVWTLAYCIQGDNLRKSLQDCRKLIWPYTSGTDETKRKIFFHAKLNRFSLSIYWYTIQAIIVIYRISIWFTEYDIVIWYWRHVLGFKLLPMVHLLTCGYMMLCSSACGLLFLLVYLYNHLISQLYLLDECLAALTEDLCTSIDEMLVSDRCYQKIMRLRLKFISERYGQIIEWVYTIFFVIFSLTSGSKRDGMNLSSWNPKRFLQCSEISIWVANQFFLV